MNSRKLYIIGAGGHGKVIADSAVKNGYKSIAFIDDTQRGTLMGFPIVGSSDMIESLSDENSDFVIAIGNNAVRRGIAKLHNVNWVTLIHPAANIGMDVKIGEGTVVMAGAVVNSGTEIGKHCIINSNSVVEHDNLIGDFVHISPGAAISGAVKIGDSTVIGSSAVVKNNLNVCNNCVIGVGATVIKDIKEPTVFE